MQTLGSLNNESTAIIAELMELLWIDRGTRFIVVDFTVYNANINLFCIVKYYLTKTPFSKVFGFFFVRWRPKVTEFQGFFNLFFDNFSNIILLSALNFCFRLVFEFPATGGVLCMSSFRTVKLFQYVTGWDFFTLGTGLVFVAFTIYYLIEETLVISL